MAITQKDRTVVRELARQVAEIAALPVQQETIALWKAINRLKPVRPMVLIDQVCWHEMNVDDELTLRTEDEFCRDLEGRLRRTLYAWKHMRADMVVEPVFDVSKVIRNTGFGITADVTRAKPDNPDELVGSAYHDQLPTEADLEKIRAPELSLDEAATARVQEKAEELFAGILNVRMQGTLPGFAMWDMIAFWRSPEKLIYDLVDRPEFTHRLLTRLTAAYLNMLDQLEAKGLLGWGQGTIHCSGAYTDELPAPGFDPAKPRAKDLWTSGMAQIFSTVSPAMHQEFELDYAVKWYSRFGLVYYGCCEPLHDKIDIIRHIPHVRKISMSPWVDIEKGAERIGREFVVSRKPSPAFLARDPWNPAEVAADLQETRQSCARHGCPLEYILKDISTVRYQPQRLWQWADVAARVARDGG